MEYGNEQKTHASLSELAGEVLTLRDGFLADRLSAVDGEIQHLYEHVPFGSHAQDAQGTYLHINSVELAWLGYSREEIVGRKTLMDFLTPASQDLLAWQLASAGQACVIVDLELELLRRDGSSMPITLSSVAYADGDGTLLKRRSVVFDMRERQENKTRQLIAETAFESLSGMYITDRQQVILQVNQAFTTLTGYSQQEALGLTTAQLLGSGLHDAAFYQALWQGVESDGSWQGEVTKRHKNGSLFTEWLSISAVTPPEGAVTHYVGSFFDITGSKRASAELLQLAHFDPLTKLPNRRWLLDRLTRAMAAAARSGLHGAVLYVDLDYFKAINDTHGREAGDLVLIEVARRLLRTVREGSSVVRLGGDEFVVVLEGLDVLAIESATQAGAVAQDILAALAQPYQFSDFEFHCTASIGLDVYVGAAPAPAPTLLQHTDLAMYQAKMAGRNRQCFFNPGMQAKVSARAALEGDLRQALDLQQFQLFYQPQVNERGEIVAAEALLRWQHPERGTVSPGEFIALAEETELIVPIGQWVLDTACRQLKVWERQPWAAHLRLAVNVSACQYRQESFAVSVEQALRASAVNPDRLVLEITESMVLDVPDAVRKMNTLKKLGVSFSMDDFGTGYSSLASLTKLPLSELKIDQSFVFNLGLEASAAVIVQAIIAMGQALGLEVIAEGVETQAQYDLLLLQGCRRFQGYMFSRPLSMEHLAPLLKHRTLAPAASQGPMRACAW